MGVHDRGHPDDQAHQMKPRDHAPGILERGTPDVPHLGQSGPHQQLSAVRAAAYGLLLAGLSGDGARVGTETERIINTGQNVTGAVLGFLTAHASQAFIQQYGTREAATNAVTAKLGAAVRAAQNEER